MNGGKRAFTMNIDFEHEPVSAVGVAQYPKADAQESLRENKSVPTPGGIPLHGGATGAESGLKIYPNPKDDAGTETSFPELEPFPVNLLPDPMREIVMETARLYQLPPDLPAALAMGAASAALGQGIQLNNPPYSTAGNVYVVISADSGTGKSLAYRFLMEPLYAAQTAKALDFDLRVRPNLESEKDIVEEKIAAVKKSVLNRKNRASPSDDETAKNQLRDLKISLEQIDALLQPPRLIVEDATSQKMALLMSHNAETIALLSPDAGDVISNILGQWTSTERADDSLLLKAYSRDPHTQDRISRPPVFLKRPCATVVLVVTPDTLKDLFSVERMSSGGLLPRFLMLPSMARPVRSNGPRCPDDGIVRKWSEGIDGLLAAYRYRAEPPAEVILAPEAGGVFDDYRNKDFVDRFDECQDIASFAARHAEQAVRIALVMHAVKLGADAAKHPLSKETAEAGVELARWFAGRQLAYMSRGRMAKRQEVANELLDLVKAGPKTLRDLERRHNYDPKVVKAIAGEFPRLLVVEEVKPQGGGRPSERLRAYVNP